ncbi:MAG: glycosyltransferase family 2 protein [Cyanobacteria bacterium J06621_11]
MSDSARLLERPLLTIIIPTYQRPDLLQRAVKSALAQRIENTQDTAVEVLVVDDCSPEPVELPAHSRLKLLRLATNRGGAAARNEGAQAASGRYVTYLDDDDQLLPTMANNAIQSLKATTLPPPVALLSGIEVVDSAGRIKSTRLPPTLPRGSHFALEEEPPGKSFLCKQTMVVERAVLLGVGGFDESFQSRVHTELFLRLNPVCSILGLSTVSYQLTAHQGPRVSRNPALRQVSFNQLLAKHRTLFEAHPQQFAQFLYKHAQISWRLGQKAAAVRALLWAFRVHPQWSFILSAYGLKDRLSHHFVAFNKPAGI